MVSPTLVFSRQNSTSAPTQWSTASTAATAAPATHVPSDAPRHSGTSLKRQLSTPYLSLNWDLQEFPTALHGDDSYLRGKQQGAGVSLQSSPHLDFHPFDDQAMPALDRGFLTAQAAQPAPSPSASELLDLGMSVDSPACERCWEETTRCADCTQLKQQQFVDGWLVEDPMTLKTELLDPAMPPIKSEYEPFSTSWSEAAPQPQQAPADEEKASAQDELPAAVPLLHSDASIASTESSRLPGRLARFLPEGVEPLMMEPLSLPPSYASDMPPLVASASASHAGRSLRVRRVRSRSPSPDLSERSSSPTDSLASESEYETDHYDAELDDTISPMPPVRVVEGGESSGQSSSEPPQPTDLLPVSASALLPARPSTAAIPPAHIKDRLVKSAKKLLTAADGVNTAVQVQVIPIWYPAKQASGAHKIRLIRVFNTECNSVSVYAHAADVGGVVERKSNISRLFGKFESPSEKLLMNVVGAHNHTVGQESNILTSKGVRKFLATNKMKDEHAYKTWISSVLLPKLLHDPLEVGTELVEIEASTDSNAPHVIKPKKMRRIEKKRQLIKEQTKADKLKQMQEQFGQQSSLIKPIPEDADDEGDSQPLKRQKLLHSPTGLHPSIAPFSAASPRFSMGSVPMSHAA